MTKEQTHRFRRMLENQRDETLRSLTRVKEEGRGLQGDCSADIGERSVVSFSREFLFQQSTQRRQLLRTIEAALERIRDGTFGECMGCGGEINEKRLEAMPFTAYCRTCQEGLERKSASERQRA